MSKKKVINFQEEKARRIYEREVDELLDTHDVVLDTSDIVLTSEDIDYNVMMTDDYLIIQTADKDDGDSQS